MRLLECMIVLPVESRFQIYAILVVDALASQIYMRWSIHNEKVFLLGGVNVLGG